MDSANQDAARVGASSMILQSLAGLPAFLVYFCTAIVAVVAYLFVYTRVTPHNEFQLIRDNDPAAAIALGLSLGLLDLERDRADRADRRLLHRQDTGAQPVGADRGRRTRRRDLAWIVLTGRGRAQRGLHDLLTWRSRSRLRNSASANRWCLTSPGPSGRGALRRSVPAMSHYC